MGALLQALEELIATVYSAVTRDHHGLKRTVASEIIWASS